jgi:hypothetical protein
MVCVGDVVSVIEAGVWRVGGCREKECEMGVARR